MWRTTVDRPYTCPPTAADSATAAISADNSRMAPFARASEADRNCAPGYSWPPHLYQDNLSLAESRAKSERNLACVSTKERCAMPPGCTPLHPSCKKWGRAIVCHADDP